jgi:NADH-quinone oxidoreductase subunit M
MSPAILALAAASILVAAALLTARAPTSTAARLRAGIGAGLALALSLGAFAMVAAGAPAPAHGLFVVDGVAAPFLPFTAALTLAAIIGAPAASLSRGWAARALLTGALLEAFVMARQPSVIVALWAGSTLPTYFDLRSPRGDSVTARVCLVHQLASALLVGAGVVLAQRPGPLSAWSAPLLVLGICARKGIFPFQAWLPALYEGGSLGTSTLFVQSHAGAYLLMRLVIAHPSAVPARFLDVLGCATALYGALLALVQPSAKRALGYIVLSQAALALVGLASGGLTGLVGCVLMIVAMGFAQAGSGIALWCLEGRRGELRIDRQGGGHDATPALAGIFLVLSLAAVGLPGALDFVAKDFVFHAALERRPWVGLVMVVTTALHGITVLRLYFALFGGARRRAGAVDLKARERVLLVGMTVALAVLGVFPRPLITPAARTLRSIRPELAARADAPAREPATEGRAR